MASRTGFESGTAAILEHDPDERTPVFGKDHARARHWSGMTVRGNVVALQSAPGVEGSVDIG
jgi:hypothetical protein